jgi:hypothetical protein
MKTSWSRAIRLKEQEGACFCGFFFELARCTFYNFREYQLKFNQDRPSRAIEYHQIELESAATEATGGGLFYSSNLMHVNAFRKFCEYQFEISQKPQDALFNIKGPSSSSNRELNDWGNRRGGACFMVFSRTSDASPNEVPILRTLRISFRRQQRTAETF